MTAAGSLRRGRDDGGIRVLYVEDDEAFADLASTMLERTHDAIDVSVETDPERALDRLDDGFDCVLSDHDMPETTGIELLEAVRERDPDVPFVLFTGKGSEEVASEAFSKGATDYFQKSTEPDYELLTERLTTAVEKRRTERELERSEQRYRRLLETAPVPIAVHHGDEIVYANGAAADFLAVDDPADLVGDDPMTYLATDDRAVAVERVGRLLAEESTVDTIEETYVDSNGEEKEALVSGAAVEYEGERAVQVVVRDITDRKRRERELERYATLVETMGDGVYALDAEGRFEMVNGRMTELTGYAREELVGMHAKQVLTDESLATAEDAIADLLSSDDGSRTVEVTATGADGERRPLELTLTLQPGDGEFVGTVGTVHDISDRLERERELAEAEEKFRKFFEHANDAVFVVDVAADEIRDANPAASDLLGYPREELVGMSPADIHPNDLDRLVAFTERVVAEGHGTIEGVECHGRDGVVESEMSAAVCEIDGRTHLINSVRDVTERKARERELERQNERLERFAGAVSHDLQNPLGIIQGRVQLAREEQAADEGASATPHLDAIADACGRMERLIDDLLTLAKQGKTVGERERVSLDDLVANVWSSLDTGDATIETETLGTVAADPERLRQALENLLHNAVEHGGADATVAVRALPDGFAVEDDGPGIPPDHREQVFERGYTSGDGTGFGLTIVRDIVEAHGWTVDAGESDAGGARVAVTGVDVER